MGLLWTDGFDSYAATADLTKKWLTANSPFAWGGATGRNGGGGVSVVASNAAAQFISAGTALPGLSTGTYVIAFYAKFTNAAPTANIVLLRITDNAGTMAGGLGIAPGRYTQLLSQGGGILLTGVRSVCDGNWHYFEWQFGLANSSSALAALYIDGLVEWNTAVNMTNSTRNPTQIRFLQNNNGIAILGLDDVIAYDSTGSPNSTSDFPLGQVTIDTIRPASDSAVTWTPNSGVTNFSRVNEVNADGDATYVESAVSGNQDLYGYGSLGGVAPTKIWGCMANTYVENPTGGTQNFNMICKSGATQATGASLLCPASYTTLQQAFNTDPNGGGAWTQASINAATFGVKVV
jgi:hypothetical protein